MPSIEISDLDTLPRSLYQAISDAPMPPLGRGKIDSDLSAFLVAHPTLDLEDTVSDDAIALCNAGLWLLAGDLDRSHTISQDLDSAEGSFWHGIMHRREGDFGNAKYWFRKVGEHEVFAQLGIDPCEFVDSCQRAVRVGSDRERCEQLQWLEWQYLMAASLAR